MASTRHHAKQHGLHAVDDDAAPKVLPRCFDETMLRGAGTRCRFFHVREEGGHGGGDGNNDNVSDFGRKPGRHGNTGSDMAKITTKDRESLLEGFGHEARLAYIAFCASRCVAEARRHERAGKQLDQEALLVEGVAMLWTAAGGATPDPTRIAAVRDHVAGFEKPHASGEKLDYARDFALVCIARVLTKGMRVLSDPTRAKPGFIVGVLDGPAVLAATTYHDALPSREKEVAVIDAALALLREANSPIDRSLFVGIIDWTRGDVSRLYADGGVTDTLSEEN